jgi:hypothetical protein
LNRCPPVTDKPGHTWQKQTSAAGNNMLGGQFVVSCPAWRWLPKGRACIVSLNRGVQAYQAWRFAAHFMNLLQNQIKPALSREL